MGEWEINRAGLACTSPHAQRRCCTLTLSADLHDPWPPDAERSERRSSSTHFCGFLWVSCSHRCTRRRHLSSVTAYADDEGDHQSPDMRLSDQHPFPARQSSGEVIWPSELSSSPASCMSWMSVEIQSAAQDDVAGRMWRSTAQPFSEH
jgi:hypothetical protein